jgi:hypothetical protein
MYGTPYQGVPVDGIICALQVLKDGSKFHQQGLEMPQSQILKRSVVRRIYFEQSSLNRQFLLFPFVCHIDLCVLVVGAMRNEDHGEKPRWACHPCTRCRGP